jgi:hypothetical protein
MCPYITDVESGINQGRQDPPVNAVMFPILSPARKSEETLVADLTLPILPPAWKKPPNSTWTAGSGGKAGSGFVISLKRNASISPMSPDASTII